VSLFLFYIKSFISQACIRKIADLIFADIAISCWAIFRI